MWFVLSLAHTKDLTSLPKYRVSGSPLSTLFCRYKALICACAQRGGILSHLETGTFSIRYLTLYICIQIPYSIQLELSFT